MILSATVGAFFLWSAIGPYDRFTWWLEVAPVLIALPILILTWRNFPLTRLVYILIAIHMIILIIGGHYSYARMPVFDWLRDAFQLSRNHYDKVGHFAQGFMPVVVTREILLRTTPLRRGKMLAFLAISVCLSLSAVYELVEWAAAFLTGEAANDFLGTQGDPWDTQKDMATCLLGSIAGLILFSQLHDRDLGQR
ncbi:MAG: DUF2238 domain-containing protein [Acidobacteria bacterium]|nr:DUF2238 domain-containing protein [Acidobacteriota bacterium]